MLYTCCFWVGRHANTRAYCYYKHQLDKEYYPDSEFETEDSFHEFRAFFSSYLLSVFDELGLNTVIVYGIKRDNIFWQPPAEIDIKNQHKWIFDYNIRK